MVLETGGGEEFHVINARIVKRGSKQLCKLLLCFTPAPCHMLPLSGWASFTAATLLSNTLSSFWEVMILNGWITLIFGEIIILNGWTGWATVNFASSVRRKPSVFWMWGWSGNLKVVSFTFSYYKAQLHLLHENTVHISLVFYEKFN